MTEIFGVPTQALFGQLLIGLINGSFYAMLSLGLAVIFGLLNIINFTHGAQYMLGAFAAWMLLDKLGVPYWWSLVVVPIVVGAFGILIERTMLSKLYKLDHLYGLLLTFGLALIIQGVFTNYFGSSGLPYRLPEEFAGAFNLGFMFLPKYRAWVVVASLVVCLSTWFVIERTKLGSYLRAATENPTVVQAFGVNVPRMITLTYGFGVGAGRARRRDGRADLPGEPADGRQPDHRRVRGRRDRRDGLDHGLDPDRLRPGHRRGADQGVLPGGVEHGDLRDHGDRAPDPAGRPVRQGALMVAPDPATPEPVALEAVAPVKTIGAADPSVRTFRLATLAMVVALAIAPWAGIYPVFLMKALCFALFACAFNLLIGYAGLLSFGHAMFFGTAGYVSAYAAKVWGFPPEFAILAGTAASTLLGVVTGALAIRRQGIYFAMITLAMAQMIFFFYLQTPFTGGEDGIQSVPRGKMFGFLDLAQRQRDVLRRAGDLRRRLPGRSGA